MEKCGQFAYTMQEIGRNRARVIAREIAVSLLDADQCPGNFALKCLVDILQFTADFGFEKLVTISQVFRNLLYIVSQVISFALPSSIIALDRGACKNFLSYCSTK